MHDGIPAPRSRHPPREQAPPQSRYPPGAGTLQEQTPQGAGTPIKEQTLPPRTGPPELAIPPAPPGSRYPPEQCMQGYTVNKRVVCILLECNLVHF